MTIKNGYPVSLQVWLAKEPSMLNGPDCQAKLKICSPSPVMVTSLSEQTKLMDVIEIIYSDFK